MNTLRCNGLVTVPSGSRGRIFHERSTKWIGCSSPSCHSLRLSGPGVCHGHPDCFQCFLQHTHTLRLRPLWLVCHPFRGPDLRPPGLPRPPRSPRPVTDENRRLSLYITSSGVSVNQISEIFYDCHKTPENIGDFDQDKFCTQMEWSSKRLKT